MSMPEHFFDVTQQPTRAAIIDYAEAYAQKYATELKAICAIQTKVLEKAISGIDLATACIGRQHDELMLLCAAARRVCVARALAAMAKTIQKEQYETEMEYNRALEALAAMLPEPT